MFSKIFATVTFRQSQITIIGTLINGILGALFYILLARFLGPSDFGLLTIAIATLTLIADIVDFGTNTGLIRFVSANISIQDKALRFLKLSLEIKIIVWLLVFSIGFVLSSVIAEKIFNKPELMLPLRLVTFGVGGALLISFATSSLQSFQKYFAWSFINIFTNFLRLMFIMILLFYHEFNLISGLMIYIILPFFGFSLSLLFLPFKKVLEVKNEWILAKQFFHYNFWVALFTIIAAISSRMDIFLNARLLTIQEVGIYGAASQLASIVPQLIGALGVVAAPKFAGFQKKSQMLTYFKKFQTFVLGLAVLGTLAIPASFYIIPLIYGSNYTGAALPFIILFLAMLVFLISVPLHNSIIFYFGKPQVFVWVALGHLLIIGFLGYLMISTYGVVGAAMTVLIGMVFNFLAPLIWFLRRIRQ